MANKMTVVDGKYLLPIDIVESGKVDKIFEVANTYADKDIKVEITTPDGELEVKDAGAVTAEVSTTDTTYTSTTETKFPIVIAADAAVTDVKVGVKTPGFVAATDVVTVEGSSAEQVTKTLYIKEGTISGTGSAAVEGGGGVEVTAAGKTAPTSGFYLKADATGTINAGAAGWVDEDTTMTFAGATEYYTIPSVALKNTADADKEYTQLSGPVLISGGALYINEGYIENSKILLKDLVPDEASVIAGETGNSYLIYKTLSVYDNDGTLVAGTMDDATLKDITLSDSSVKVETVTVAPNADNSAFKVTGAGEGEVTATAEVKDKGYVNETFSKQNAISLDAAVDATIAKIGIGVANVDDIELAPNLAKDDTTNVKSGDVASTKPTEGRYLAVTIEATNDTATLSPVVNTAGYGTTDVFSGTDNTVKATVENATYYVPLDLATHTLTPGENQITKAATTVDTNVTGTVDVSAGILVVQPADGEYITIGSTTTTTDGKFSNSISCEVVEGYAENDTKTSTVSGDIEVQATEAAPKYIKIYDGSYL